MSAQGGFFMRVDNVLSKFSTALLILIVLF